MFASKELLPELFCPAMDSSGHMPIFSAPAAADVDERRRTERVAAAGANERRQHARASVSGG